MRPPRYSDSKPKGPPLNPAEATLMTTTNKNTVTTAGRGLPSVAPGSTADRPYCGYGGLPMIRAQKPATKSSLIAFIVKRCKKWKKREVYKLHLAMMQCDKYHFDINGTPF